MRHWKPGQWATLSYAALFTLWLLALPAFVGVWQGVQNPDSITSAFSVGSVIFYAAALAVPWLIIRFFLPWPFHRVLHSALLLLWFLAVLSGFGLWQAWENPQAVFEGLTVGLLVSYILGLVALYLLIYGGFLLYSRITESEWWREQFLESRGGSARFAGAWPLLMHNWMFCEKAPIYLGQTTHKYDPWVFGQHIGVDDDNHVITIAQPGSGKSTTAIWPNLIRYPYPDSTFILDPKGEHTAATFKHREQLGPVYVLDPQNMLKGRFPTVDFNPLDEIDPYAGDARERFMELASALYVSTDSKNENAHFRESAIALIAGMCAHIKTWPTYPPETHNLSCVYDLLVKGKIGPVDGPPDPKAFDNLLAEMEQNPAAGELPVTAVHGYLKRAGQNEGGSMFTTLTRCISWAASDNMRKHMIKSDFRLSELREKVCTVYVVLDYSDMHPDKLGRFMRVLMYQALDASRKTSLPAVREDAGRRTLFILDEVGMLGPMTTTQEAFKILRSSHVKMWCFFQEEQTMRTTFPQADSLMASSTKQFFGISEPNTAKTIETYLGQFMDARMKGDGSGQGHFEQSKAVMTASEITMKLKQKSMAQIVITGGGYRFELKRVPCFPGDKAVSHSGSASSVTDIASELRGLAKAGQDLVEKGREAHAEIQWYRTHKDRPANKNPPPRSEQPEMDEGEAMAVFGLSSPFSMHDLNRRRFLLKDKTNASPAYARVVNNAYRLLSQRAS